MRQAVRAYQAFMEHSPVPMVLADRASLRYLAVNSAALKLYGYSREELLRMTIKDLRYGLWKHVRKDGSLIEVEVYPRDLKIEGRAVILSTLIDIKEKQRAQSELEKSRNLLDGVMANVPAFVLKIDHRLRIAYINKLAKGFKMSDVIGSDALSYVDPRDRARIGRDLRAVFRTGQPSVCEIRGQGDFKATRYYLTRLQPVFEQGRVRWILMLATDITDRRMAEEALRRSWEHYRALFEGHPLPMWVGDYETLRILDVNQAAVRAFGYSREEFIGKSILELQRKKDVPLLRKRIRSAKPGPGMNYQGPTVYLRKDGTAFESEIYVGELEFEGRRAFVTSVMDLSERIKGREAQERFAGLFNSSRDGLSFVAMDGTLLEINDALCRMLRYRRSELIGRKTFLGLTVPEYHEISQAVVDRVLATGEAAEFEKEYFRKDGSRMPAVVTVFRVNGVDRSSSGVAAIVRDSTERKRLEREILEIGAREQSRIGRELHDSLGQHLTGVSFLAKSLKAQLSREGSPQARLAERIARMASDAVERVRALAAGLVPAELLPDGLPAALRSMAVQAERTFGIEVSVDCPARLAGMEEASLLHLYRIAQEATANAAKHSGASKVSISLREGGGRLVLEIFDNGKGIARREGKGLGLRIMAHRAQMLGGIFEVKRGKADGTVVRCTCPARRLLLY